VENLSFELPAPASLLLQRWREAARIAHEAECAALRSVVARGSVASSTALELKSTALELRRVAEQLRQDALHAANFAPPLLPITLERWL
jgi:hypothetical protein